MRALGSACHARYRTTQSLSDNVKLGRYPSTARVPTEGADLDSIPRVVRGKVAIGGEPISRLHRGFAAYSYFWWLHEAQSYRPGSRCLLALRKVMEA
jgi:hypothetical protein